MQLWHSGMIQNIDRDHRGMVNIQPENLVDYGVDGFAQGDFGNQDNHVEVPEIEFGLDEQRLQQLYRQVRPTDDDGKYGMNHFINVINFISVNYA